MVLDNLNNKNKTPPFFLLKLLTHCSNKLSYVNLASTNVKDNKWLPKRLNFYK